MLSGSMAEGRRTTRNGVPGKIVEVKTYPRFVADEYDKKYSGSKKKR
jgi:hypothetical protein